MQSKYVLDEYLNVRRCFTPAKQTTERQQTGESVMRTKVMKINRVSIVATNETEPKMLFCVEGTVASGGWKNPKLEPRSSVNIDGEIEFDFTAEAPTGNAITMLSLISTRAWVPTGAKVIKVYGTDSEPVVVIVPEKDNLTALPRLPAATHSSVMSSGIGGGEVPWPFGGGGIDAWPFGGSGVGAWPFSQGSILQGNPETVRELVGLTIRVLGPDDFGTTDYVPTRVTFLVDANRRIIDIQFG